MIEKILEFMDEAGEIALNVQNSINLTGEYVLKDSDIYSIVTKADYDISTLFNAFIKKNFSNIDHIIVDEESLESLGDKPYKKILNT